MNEQSSRYDLNDGALDQVSGGMKCSTAMALAKFYIATGDILGTFGNSAGAAAFYGRAQGVLEGGCGK